MIFFSIFLVLVIISVIYYLINLLFFHYINIIVNLRTFYLLSVWYNKHSSNTISMKDIDFKIIMSYLGTPNVD